MALQHDGVSVTEGMVRIPLVFPCLQFPGKRKAVGVEICIGAMVTVRDFRYFDSLVGRLGSSKVITHYPLTIFLRLY
jgi:hypothetical protein